MFKDRLRDLRIQRQLSRSDLAESLGVSQASIGNYERGDRQPDAETIVKISKYFNVTSDWLLGLSEKTTPNTGDNSVFSAETIDFFRSQPIDTLVVLDNIIASERASLSTLFMDLWLLDKYAAPLEQTGQYAGGPREIEYNEEAPYAEQLKQAEALVAQVKDQFYAAVVPGADLCKLFALNVTKSFEQIVNHYWKLR